jgi:hypothetical protein
MPIRAGRHLPVFGERTSALPTMDLMVTLSWVALLWPNTDRQVQKTMHSTKLTVRCAAFIGFPFFMFLMKYFISIIIYMIL